jgi:hypothetical protein
LKGRYGGREDNMEVGGGGEAVEVERAAVKVWRIAEKVGRTTVEVGRVAWRLRGELCSL